MWNSNNVFVNKVQLNLVRNTSFICFHENVNVDKVCQVRVNSRNFGFTQIWENNTSMAQTKEKHDCLVLSRSLTFEWYEDDMVFRVFIVINFVQNKTVKKDTWRRMTSVTVMVIFFESGILKVT